MNPLELYEAYAAVYDEDLREDLLIEETILFESIDELYDDELEEIVEESIYSMLDEGYEIDEVEEIFEEIFSEARVDMAARKARRDADRQASEKSAKEARDRAAASERAERRRAAAKKIKDMVKKTAGDIKSAAQKTASDIKSKAKEAKYRAVDAPAAKYAADRGIGGPGPGLAARSKDPAKRRALRSAVLGDIASRAKAKLGRGVERVRAAGERAVGAVKTSSDAAQGRLRGAGASAREGARGLAARGARAVSRGARDVARRLGEDVDLYDVVLEHLLDEGYAETEEAATVIMANMSEEWKDEILEAMSNYEKNRRRAAQRAAARNEARRQGKTGNVPGVGYVSPRQERETWTDESGRTRHAKGL